jgi:peptide/nickel transport system substrate-binding protein
MFHSSQMVEEGDDFMSYANPQLDKVIDEARRTIDEPKRMDLWRKAHAIIHEDQPYTFLFFGKSLVFLDNRIGNVQLVKLGLNPRVEWFVAGPKQKYHD